MSEHCIIFSVLWKDSSGDKMWPLSRYPRVNKSKISVVYDMNEAHTTASGVLYQINVK
jgi:hypothetical protein